jgi:uncharacterized membrane protein
VQTRDLIQTALMVALCVAIGYLMIPIPNIELLSAAVFTCGVLRGSRRGALVGVLTMVLFGSINPMGISPPPMFVAQLLGMGIVGGAGGLLGRVSAPGLLAGLAAVAGFVLTVLNSVLVDTGGWLAFRESTSWGAMVFGGLNFPFPLARPLINTVSFGLVVPAVVAAMAGRRTP